MAKYIEDFRAGDTVKIKLDYGGQDVTGFKWWLTLKAEFGADDYEAELKVEKVAGDHADDDEAHGVVWVVVPSSSTLGLNPGKYLYDMTEKAASGDIRTLFPPPVDHLDRVQIIPRVTRDLP